MLSRLEITSNQNGRFDTRFTSFNYLFTYPFGHFGDFPVTVVFIFPLTHVMVKFFPEAEPCFEVEVEVEAFELFFAGGIFNVTVGAEKPKL